MKTHPSIRTTLVAGISALGLVAALAVVTGCSDSGQAAQSGQTAQADGQQAGSVRAAALADTPGIDPPTAPQPGDRRIITVTGVGKVTGTPDTVTVRLGVQTRAPSASKALAENNKAANRVIDKLRGAGVAKKDLQTSRLSIQPQYSSKGETITGYEVSNFVTATLHDTSKAGGMIDAAQQAAGDAIRVNGIRFSFADDSKLRAQAREQAVKQAMAQAKQLADAAGLTAGPVLSIREGAAPTNPTPMTLGAAESAAGAASMPTEPGSQDLTVDVQVVVAIG